MVLVMTAVSVVDDVRARVDLQPGRARLHRGAVRLHSQANNNGSAFAGYGATSFSADVRHGRAATSAASCRCSPRSRSPARSPAKKIAPASAGTFRTDGPTFVVLLVGVIAAHRRPDDLPGADARADRRGADALMLRDLKSLRDRRRRADARVRLALPALLTGFAQVAFSSQANGSLIKVERQGRRLAARRRRRSRSRSTSTRARRRPRRPTTPAGRPSRTSARPIPDLAKNVKAAGARRS